MKTTDEGSFRLAIKGDTLFDRSGNEYRVEGRTSTPDGEWLCVGAVKPKPKVIDWSRLHPDVPVETPNLVKFPTTYGGVVITQPGATLETGKWIAWFGGACPVPEGVMVEVMTRGAETDQGQGKEFEWKHKFSRSFCDEIIAFRVTGLADGYCYWEAG